MGDVTWLTELGPSGLAALAVGLVLLVLVGALKRAVSYLMLGKLVPREALDREQENTEKWRQAYLVEAETNGRWPEIVRQLTQELPPPSATGPGRHRRVG